MLQPATGKEVNLAPPGPPNPSCRAILVIDVERISEPGRNFLAEQPEVVGHGMTGGARIEQHPPPVSRLHQD